MDLTPRWFEIADTLWLAGQQWQAEPRPEAPEVGDDRADDRPPALPRAADDRPQPTPPDPGRRYETDPFADDFPGEPPEQSSPRLEPAPAEPVSRLANVTHGAGDDTGDDDIEPEDIEPDRIDWGPTRWPSVVTIPDATRISKALRPLRLSAASHTDWILDEEATAEAGAEDGLWLPVTAPAAERWWDLVLVVDDYPSMMSWRDSVRDFLTLLEQLGAFRTISVRSLRSALSGPRQLIDPTGRRIILVLTDGLAPDWKSGNAGPALHTWGRRLPVALVHVLPQQAWHRTHVRPRRVRLRATAPGCANTQLDWVSRDGGRDLIDDPWPRYERNRAPGHQTTTVIPVLELSHRFLDPWARLVAGAAGWTNLTAIRAEGDTVAGSTEDEGGSAPLEPGERVERFRAAVTPTAFDLATLLAAAPLNLPVMRAIQSELLPTSRPFDLSEFLNSGLVRVLAHGDTTRADQVTIDFEPGVREELLAFGHRTGTEAVVRVVDHYLGSRVGATRELRSLLDEPHYRPPLRVTQDSAPFLRVGQAVFKALAGPYRASSDWLGDQLSHRPDADAVRTLPRPVSAPGDGAPENSQNVLQSENLPISRDIDPLNIEGAPVTTITEPSTGRTGGQEPSVWGNVPPRNVNFTGRESLLADLHRRLGAGTTAVLPQALHGMGGVGKSQLAVEYVYQHRFDYDLVWWISAERPAQISQSLVELAQRLGLPTGSEANSAVPAVLEALRTGHPFGNWLLVYDNAESPEVIWPAGGDGRASDGSTSLYVPTSGPGRVLITSRNPQWASRANPVEVDVFRREESVTLRTRWDPNVGPSAADRLATALGDLPLAIEQAAAWRAETGMPVDEYLQLLREQTTELLALSPPADYPLPVAAAWNIALKRLKVSNRGAWRLLQICGFYAAEPVSRVVLSGARGTRIHPDLDPILRSPIQLSQSIREINRLGLARIDHRTNAILMHRLVQVVVTAQLGPEEYREMQLAAQLLLAASDREDPISPANWGQYGDLYPHVIASDAVNTTDPYVRQLVLNEARFLYYWGEHEASAELSEKLYEVWRNRLGEDDPQTLDAARWLGFIRLIVGEYPQAASLNARTLEISRRVNGDNHEATLDAMGAVAADRRVRGDFTSALELSQQVYDRMVTIAGERDPNTLNAAHNLAVSLRLAGDFIDARRVDEITWQQKVETFGTDNDTALMTLAGLNIDRRELGEYIDARSAEEDIVSKYRRLAPHERHPMVLRALRNLSVSRRKAGAHQAALEASQEVREQFVQRYGEDYPDTMAASLNLAVDLRTTGDLAQARVLGEDTWQRYRRTLGETHPHTLSASCALAITLRLSGDVEAAVDRNTLALASLRDRLGPDHPLTLVAGLNLASDLYAVGDFQQAHDEDADTVSRMTRMLGADHPTTLFASANLGLDLRALGRDAEGEAMRAGAIAGLERRLGSEHPVVVAARDQQRLNVDLDPMPL